MDAFNNFLTINKLKKGEIASFLGVSRAFITQISSGQRKLPDDKLALITANKDWDTSMFASNSGAHYLSLLSGIRGRSREVTPEKIQSAIKEALNPDEKFLIGYLERKVSDQEVLIRELYQQIGMLEAKLDLARKGEIASVVGGSSDANVG